MLSSNFQNGAGLLSGMCLVGIVVVPGARDLRLCTRGAGVCNELTSGFQALDVRVGDDPAMTAARPEGRRLGKGDSSSDKAGRPCVLV